jgi:hypothetical protein
MEDTISMLPPKFNEWNLGGGKNLHNGGVWKFLNTLGVRGCRCVHEFVHSMCVEPAVLSNESVVCCLDGEAGQLWFL